MVGEVFVWAVLEADSVVSSGWCLAGGGDVGWLSGASGTGVWVVWRVDMVGAFGVQGPGRE